MNIYERKQLIPIFIISIWLLFSFGGDSAMALFQFERNAILNGEFWRLLTGHFVHNNWTHLFLNMTGFIVIWFLTKDYLSFLSWCIVIVTSAFFTSLCILFFMINIEWYLGFSGVLHAIFIAGVLAGIKKGYKEAYILLLILAVKIIWEQKMGGITSTLLENETILIDAHLYGIICGILAFALVFKRIEKLSIR